VARPGDGGGDEKQQHQEGCGQRGVPICARKPRDARHAADALNVRRPADRQRRFSPTVLAMPKPRPVDLLIDAFALVSDVVVTGVVIIWDAIHTALGRKAR